MTCRSNKPLWLTPLMLTRNSRDLIAEERQHKAPLPGVSGRERLRRATGNRR